MTQRIRFAIDVGSGFIDEAGRRHNSATGFCIYDPNTDQLIDAGEIRTFGKATTWKRTRELATSIRTKLNIASSNYGPLEVRIEIFVMKGLAAEVLYRLTGAYIAAIPMNADFCEIHNITLKKDLTGDGKADKTKIANTLVSRFTHDAKSLDMVKKLIDNKNEDALDAIAIAICRERVRR